MLAPHVRKQHLEEKFRGHSVALLNALSGAIGELFADSLKPDTFALRAAFFSQMQNFGGKFFRKRWGCGGKDRFAYGVVWEVCGEGVACERKNLRRSLALGRKMQPVRLLPELLEGQIGKAVHGLWETHVRVGGGGTEWNLTVSTRVDSAIVSTRVSWGRGSLCRGSIVYAPSEWAVSDTWTERRGKRGSSEDPRFPWSNFFKLHGDVLEPHSLPASMPNGIGWRSSAPPLWT